jgi:putative FmdB family regulatory protein
MPIYAYKCEACGHELDALQKISDAPLTQCPECGAPALKKQLTAAGFQLKGSGWYATDFRDGGNGAKKPAEGAADAAAAAPAGDGAKANDKAVAGDAAGGKSAETGAKPSGTTDSGAKGDGAAAKPAPAASSPPPPATPSGGTSS